MSKNQKDKARQKEQEKTRETEKEEKKEEKEKHRSKEKEKKEPDKRSQQTLEVDKKNKDKREDKKEEKKEEKKQDKREDKKEEKKEEKKDEKKETQDKKDVKSKDIKQKKPATTIRDDTDGDSSDEEEAEPPQRREAKKHRPLTTLVQKDRVVMINIKDFTKECWGSEAGMSAYLSAYLERPREDSFVNPWARIPRGEKLELAPEGNFRVEVAGDNGRMVVLKRFRTSIPLTKPMLVREMHFTCALSDCKHVVAALMGSGFDTETGELFFLIEYHPLGDMETQTMAPGGLPLPSSKCFLRDLLHCLFESLERNITHRDTRLSNAVLTLVSGYIVKVLDWGTATRQKKDQPLQTETGTDDVSAWIKKIVPELTEDDASLKGLPKKERQRLLDENAAARVAASQYFPVQLELRSIAWTLFYALGLATEERNAYIRKYIEAGMPEDDSIFGTDNNILRDMRAVDPEKEQFVLLLMDIFRGDEEAERLARTFVANFKQIDQDDHVRHVEDVVIPRTIYINFILLAQILERSILLRQAPQIFGIANALHLSLARCSQALFTNTFDQIPGYEALSEEKKEFIERLKNMPAWPETPKQARFVEKLWYTSLIAFFQHVRNFDYVGVLAAILESSGYDDQTFILKVITSRRNLKAAAKAAGLDRGFMRTEGFKKIRNIAREKNAEVDEQEKQELEERASKIQALVELEKAEREKAEREKAKREAAEREAAEREEAEREKDELERVAREAASKKRKDKKRPKKGANQSSSSSSDSTPEAPAKKAKTKPQPLKSKHAKESSSSESESSSSSDSSSD